MKLFNRTPRAACYFCGRAVEVPEDAENDPSRVFVCRECNEKLSHIHPRVITSRAELNEIAEKLLSLPVSDFAYVMDLISSQLQTISELQCGSMEGC